MIEHGDLVKPAHLYVLDGEERSWRTLWRKRVRRRLVWAGFIDSWSAESTGATRIELVDPVYRLKRMIVFPETEPLDDDEAEKLRAEWTRKYGGGS